MPDRSDSDLLETARKRFDYCIDAKAREREFQREDQKFFAGSPDNGWQWPDKVLSLRQNDPNGARPCLTINKIPQHVRHVTNEQRQNRPTIKVLPMDSKADKDVAEMLNGVIRHIEYQSDADTAYDTASQDQVVSGEGYWRILTEYIDDTSFDQDIFIKRIANAMSVYLDPDLQQPDGSDARYGFIIEDMPEETFKQCFPDADEIDWSPSDEYKNWRLTGERKIRIAEYFYIEEETSTLTVGEKSRKVKRKIVKWCKLNGSEILDKRVWPGKHIPIVPVVGNEFWIDGICYRSGMVRNLKDSQRMFNYWSSQETEMLALAPKAPFIGAAGQFEGYEDKWGSANHKNYAYLEYNPTVEDGKPVPPPQRAMPPMPSAGILQAKMGAADDMKSESGQYDPSLGNNPQSQSGVALRSEQKKSEVVNFHYIDNLSKSIRHTGRIILDLIPKVIDTRRVARILGEDGTADQVLIDPALQQPMQSVQRPDGREIGKIYNPTIGRYDVAVTVGPSYTTQRQETAQMLVELSQGTTDPVVALVMRYLAVKNMDWSGAGELADVLKKLLPPQLMEGEGDEGLPPEIQAQVQAAQQMIEQKDAELQQIAQQVQEEKMTVEQAKGELEKLLSEIRGAQSELKAQQQMLQADKQIAIKDIQLAESRLDGKATIAMGKMEQADQSVNAVNEQVMQMMAHMIETTSQIAQGFQSVAEAMRLAAAPRETRIVLDESGMPVGAMSQPVEQRVVN